MDIDKLDLKSHDLTEDKKQELLRIFPEIRTEGGKIDLERLKLVLGETVDVGKERYGMNWPGKADCFKTIQSPSMGTLRPRPEESVNFDTTENMIIEGDNLEVLKLLQKSFLGKVKVICTDPPYNTGNDFIYPDNYTESLQTYLEYTGQVDAGGKKFSTNTESDGRFHSKWINMMYPRLYLARNLLSDDGFIFISIDDDEFDNLCKICNNIFGEEAFVATFVWRRRKMADSRNLDKASTDHEYVLCYKKADGMLKGQEINKSKYSNPDNDPRGPWFSADLTGLANKEQRPNLHYALLNPETGQVYPPSPTRGWSCSKKTMQRFIEEGKILWPSKPEGRPRYKKFLNEVQRTETGFSTFLDVGQTTEGTRKIQDLFELKVFPFAKPVSLLRVLVNQVASHNDIVLDIFAGSGTTGHAVLEQNKQDGGNRKFILVQLPEPTGREDYPTIADICKERVRRVINNLNKEDEGKLPFGGDKKPDRGFRVFKLDESNFKTWNANVPKGDVDALNRQLELHIDHIREGRTTEDILYEILLKSGFSLTTPIEKLIIEGNTVFSGVGGAFFICLERKLTLELIRAMAKNKPERVVFLDEGFAGNDQLKANAVQIFKTNGITSFKTV